jgi:hypothetical protein
MKEDAVSAIIGSLLALIIFVSFLSILQVTQVPAMNREAEIQHDFLVQDDFFDLRSRIQDSASSTYAKSARISMGIRYPTLPIFLRNPVPGTFGSLLITYGKSVKISYYGASGTYESVSKSETFEAEDFPFTAEEDMTEVTRFEITITDLQESGPPGPERRMVIQTTGYNSLTRFSRPKNTDDLIIQNETDTDTIPDYFSAPSPLDFLFYQPGLRNPPLPTDIDFSLQPDIVNPADGEYILEGIRGQISIQEEKFNNTTSFIHYTPNNNHWVEIGYSYENDAIIRVQDGSNFTLSNSTLLFVSHDSVENTTLIRIYPILLKSLNHSISQSHPLFLNFFRISSLTREGDAYNLSISVETEHQGLWEEYFINKMAGVPSSDWEVSTTGNEVELVVDRGSPPKIELEILISEVSVEL